MKLTTRRSIIALLFIAQAVSLVALFVVSGRIAAVAESDHQDALLNTESAEAIDRLRAHIQPAEAIVQFTSQALENELVETDALLGSFRDAMVTTPQLDGVFVGEPDGSFTYLSRGDEDGFRLKQIDVTGESRQTFNIAVDNDGNELDRVEDPADEYDPRQRPWYQLAAANLDGVSWTDPYVFFTSRQLGITSTAPIVRDGEVVGVVGADIELGSLSSFLNSLDTGQDGGAIIVNDSGVVVAHPSPSLVQRAEGETINTVAIAELDDPLARAAVASYVQTGIVETTTLTEFDGEEIGPSRGSFRNVEVGNGEWTVGVFGPEDSMVGGLASARAAERTLLVTAGVIGLLLGAALFFRATRPLDELEQHAWSDALTGLPNRRHILRSVDEEIVDSDETSSLAMLDIDRFKSVNDTYGHQVGDQVLVEVATRASEVLPDGCQLGRLGGEEFIIVMPGSGQGEAWKICEAVRNRIQGSLVQHSTGALEVTVSLGIATSEGQMSRGHLIAVADAALLEAKSTGRNKVVQGGGLRSVDLGGAEAG